MHAGRPAGVRRSTGAIGDSSWAWGPAGVVAARSPTADHSLGVSGTSLPGALTLVIEKLNGVVPWGRSETLGYLPPGVSRNPTLRAAGEFLLDVLLRLLALPSREWIVMGSWDIDRSCATSLRLVCSLSQTRPPSLPCVLAMCSLPGASVL